MRKIRYPLLFIIMASIFLAAACQIGAKDFNQSFIETDLEFKKCNAEFSTIMMEIMKKSAYTDESLLKKLSDATDKELETANKLKGLKATDSKKELFAKYLALVDTQTKTDQAILEAYMAEDGTQRIFLLEKAINNLIDISNLSKQILVN